jgi:outer membrane protein TolC
LRKVSIFVVSVLLVQNAKTSNVLAQQTPLQPLTLNQAVDLALSNYPSIRAAQAQAAAASAGIELARTAYLPRTDLLWQENRATRNNVFGLLLPQAVIPPISGPVLGTKTFESAWGSAGGMLLSFEPFDFGQRKANVDVARALTQQANAGVELTRLDAAVSAADAFLAVLAAEETIRAAQANVTRMETFAKAVHVLVDNQLRAGADASRADAELAAARIQHIQAQQTVELNRARLAEALGVAGTAVAVDAGPFLELPPVTSVPTPNLESHPQAVVQAAAVETARARERILDRSYFPRFNFQAGISARGTGAPFNGVIESTKGLLPQTPNWASGMSVSFPLFDVFSIRARRRIEASNEAAERARYDQTIQTLKGQDARARALIDGALRIAENTPIQLKAAQEAEIRARARYNAQLANVIEVAEAQRLLAQAEIDDAVARLGVWRALLVAARVQGDLKPFLQQASSTSTQRRK